MLFMRKSKQIVQNWTICLLFSRKEWIRNYKIEISNSIVSLYITQTIIALEPKNTFQSSNHAVKTFSLCCSWSGISQVASDYAKGWTYSSEEAWFEETRPNHLQSAWGASETSLPLVGGWQGDFLHQSRIQRVCESVPKEGDCESHCETRSPNAPLSRPPEHQARCSVSVTRSLAPILKT